MLSKHLGQLVERGATLTIDRDPWLDQFRPYYDDTLAVVVSRELTGHPLRPVEVGLPYNRPQDVSALKKFFGGSLSFANDAPFLAPANSDLELPVRGVDSALGRYLDRYAEQVMEELSGNDTLMEKIQRALFQDLNGGAGTLQGVSSSMGMSERTLQRRLAARGTSFAEVIDDFRKRLAQQLLEDSEVAVSEVAYLLGYSEPSAFRRAFKRWTGTTPRSFKNGRM